MANTKKDKPVETEPTPSDQVRADIEAQDRALEENPTHPEEAIETQYLEGGEIPANAPGTEGMARA